jgi:CO/xanthine dehydrogenase Mo-binding subunit
MDGVASPFRTPVVALDGPDKVTGAARYTFDVSVPGMLHAKVLRSPYPHAGILSIVPCALRRSPVSSQP